MYSIYEEINQASERMRCIPPTKHDSVYFYNDYAGSLRDENVYGLISFSKIAYNEINNQAIICYEDYGAPMSGVVALAYFKKENEVWQLIGYHLLWIY